MHNKNIENKLSIINKIYSVPVMCDLGGAQNHFNSVISYYGGHYLPLTQI
jgi:hypothetical protein